MSPAAIPAFLWKVEGIGVSVAISRSVLAELHAGLDHTPADAEFGGILLGNVAPDEDGFRTQVDAFEPFTIEHRHGANYALSPRDQRVLEQRLKRLRRKGRVPVGICRSHQRRGLYLDQRDFDLFQTDFRHPSSIFLLVGRHDADGATGAVFVWEEDDIRRHASYLEFPLFDSPAEARVEPVRAVQRLRVSPAVSASVDRSGEVDLARLARLPAIPSFPRATVARVLLTVTLPLLSFYAAREIAFHRARTSAADPGRPAAQARLPLPRIDRDRIPATAQKPDPFNAASPVAPHEAGVSGPPSKPESTHMVNSQDRSESDADGSPSAGRPILRADDPPARAIPVLPEPPPIQPMRPTSSVPRILASQPRIAGGAADEVVVYLTPATPSSIRYAIQKVFTGHGAGEGFVPADPVESPLPAPPSSAEPLEEGTNIEMLAKVDRLGNVVNVKVVDGNRQLADLSTGTVRRWRFNPARRNGAPVESAIRIRFEFRNLSK